MQNEQKKITIYYRDERIKKEIKDLRKELKALGEVLWSAEPLIFLDGLKRRVRELKNER